MIWKTLFSALALVFVIEGILPFLSPSAWRRTLQAMLSVQSDTTVRMIGLISMLVGLVIVYWVRTSLGE